MKKLYIICLLILSMAMAILPVSANAEVAFNDMEGHWASEFVIKAANEGLFVGDSDGNFHPDADVTRAQFITVLWRMAGRPDAAAELPFTDIENQLPEFKQAIGWGYEKGYIKGTTETTFDPDTTLTRESAMKILHLYSGGQTGGEFQFFAIYDGLLEDSSEISSWAKSSVYWGIYNKLISGTSETTIAPKGTATRAQLARIMVSYLGI